jgi:hypothetical protein
MYIVFIVYSFYSFLKIISETDVNWSSLSYRWGYFFYTQLIIIFFRTIIKFYKKIQDQIYNRK